MIYLFCGDDTAASRNAFHLAKVAYKQKNYEVIAIGEKNITELEKWLVNSQNLFWQNRIFAGENLLSKKEYRDIFKNYDTKDENAIILLWDEEIDERSAKRIFKTARLSISKLPSTIFKFLDAVYPSNKTPALRLLQDISQSIDEHIILYMLQKRIRELIAVTTGKTPEKLQQWQIAKLSMQSKKWKEQQLLSFYDALYRIEVYAKTNTHYYSIKKSLDIALCYSI
ncbi:MAG TPA: hypothetical protein VJH96_01530 [Patescibacteria group bacterium]|nr:hypothetical protein [Patescibacteria group bacterium]